MTEQQQPFRGVGGDDNSSTGVTDEDELRTARIANRFDIRRIIGGLFVLYGVILVVVGIVGSDEVKNKAAGVNVNLWTGLAMLVVGGLMIFWALARPVMPAPQSTRGEDSVSVGRAPAT